MARAAGQMAIGTLLLLLSGVAAKAAEIHVLAPTTIRAVINALDPQFERATGHKLIVEYDVAPVVKRQIEEGKEFDLVIVTRPLMDDLIKQARVLAETRFDIGRAGAGVAVRAGAPRPDVGSRGRAQTCAPEREVSRLCCRGRYRGLFLGFA